MAPKEKSKTSKRTVINPHRRPPSRAPQQKRLVQEEVNVGRSLAEDKKRKAKTKVKKGQGDRGDVKL